MSTTINGLAGYLFSKLDTGGKGYIEKTDLQSAFALTTSASSNASADDLFSSLDSDGDGKVTQDEMTSGIRQLAAALDGQFQDLRMTRARDGAGAMPPPPPPPPADDAGFTKDELQSQLDAIGSSDSERSSLISSIVANFSAADSDGDGKVSFSEAMAYDRGTATASSTTAGSEGDSELKLLLTVMQLVQAYRSGNDGSAAASVLASA